MAGFIEGVDHGQTVLFPDRLEDWIVEDNLVRVVDLFVDELDLPGLDFVRSAAARTVRPGYHPAVLLNLFIYGYLNRVPSSRRLECEAGRNVEAMWLTGRLVPDHKTIANFRHDNGPAVRRTCAQFVELCRRIGTLKGGTCFMESAQNQRWRTPDRMTARSQPKPRVLTHPRPKQPFGTEAVNGSIVRAFWACGFRQPQCRMGRTCRRTFSTLD